MNLFETHKKGPPKLTYPGRFPNLESEPFGFKAFFLCVRRVVRGSAGRYEGFTVDTGRASVVMG